MAEAILKHTAAPDTSPETRLAAFEASIAEIVRALEACEIGFLETLTRLRQAIDASRASRRQVA